MSEGLGQIYHFHGINFEAAVEWRSNDILETEQGRPEQWVYTVTSAARSPIRLEIRLTHALSPGEIEHVEGSKQPAQVWLLMGDLGGQGRLSYHLRLFQGKKEVRYVDHPGGVDYETSGMTFRTEPELGVLKDSLLVPVSINHTGAHGKPAFSTDADSFLCAVSFGQDGPAWDRAVLEFAAVKGTVIPAETQMRIILAGAPLTLSSHVMPCRSRPLSPMLMLHSSKKQTFPIGELVSRDPKGIATFYSPDAFDSVFAAFNAIEKPSEPVVEFPFTLRKNVEIPATETVNLALNSDGFTNNQPSQVTAFTQFEPVPLAKLLAEPWARQPMDWPAYRPPTRPLWESSFALSQDGPSPLLVEKNFQARAMNARRMVGGSIDGKPAVWWQRQDSPISLSEKMGRIDGLNDQLRPVAVGQCEKEGRALPCVWSHTGDAWRSEWLAVPPFTLGGGARSVNEAGLVCGYVDVQVSVEPRRIPCVWVLGDSGYAKPMVLPVPNKMTRAEPLDMNADGVIVGYAEDRSGKRLACRWAPRLGGYKFESLRINGTATGINVFGFIVGNDDEGAFFWQSGEGFSITERSNSPIAAAIGISDLSDIVASTTKVERVLLQPKAALGF